MRTASFVFAFVCSVLIACGGRLSSSGTEYGDPPADSDGGDPDASTCDLSSVTCLGCPGFIDNVSPHCDQNGNAVCPVYGCPAVLDASTDDASADAPWLDTDAGLPTSDGSVVGTDAGAPCNPGSCDDGQFCQQQADFSYRCEPLPSQCTADDSCTCVLDHMTSHCPTLYGWACGESAGLVTITCTAP